MKQQSQIATVISGIHIGKKGMSTASLGKTYFFSIGREETSTASLGKTYFVSIITILLAAPIDHSGAVTI